MRKNLISRVCLVIVALITFSTLSYAQTVKLGKEVKMDADKSSASSIVETSKGIFCVYTPTFTGFFKMVPLRVQRYNFVKIDTEKGSIALQKQERLKASVVEKLEGERAVQKDKGIAGQFKIQTIIRKDDGGLVLLLERKGSQEVANNIKYLTRKEVLTINMSPNGTIEWTNILDKDQRIQDGAKNSISFGTAVVKDKIFLFFHINDKVLLNKNPFAYIGPGRAFGMESFLIAYQIQANGKSTHKIVFRDKKDDDSVTEPTKIFQMPDTYDVYVLVYERKSDTQRLAKIIFE